MKGCFVTVEIGFHRVALLLLGLAGLAGCEFLRGHPERPPSDRPPLVVPGLVTGTEELWIIAKDSDPVAASAVPALPYLQRTSGTAAARLLPLQRTDVHATIDAYVATVRVQQSFANPFTEAIDVEYVFALPDDSAVSELLIRIGERHIRGVVRPRRDAEEMFAEAQKRGWVVALLSASAPNVFRQHIANLAAGQNADVSITYFNTLAYRDGAYEMLFPLRRAAAETEAKVLGGEKPAPVSLQVDIAAGAAIGAVTSPSHDIKVEPRGDSGAHVELVDTQATRDFVLRLQTAATSTPRPSFLAHRDEHGGFFVLTLQPPADLGAVESQPLEVILVADCSAAMNADAMAQARTMMARALRKLQANDTFQVAGLAVDVAMAAPVAASAQNVARVAADLDSICGDGGPLLPDALRTALQLRRDGVRRRLVLVLSNGRSGNEWDLAAVIRENLESARIISIGVGAAPNRVVLEGMARLGRGAVAYLGNDDSEPGIDELLAQLHQPLLSDIEIDWGDLGASDIVPRRIPDLFPGRPVVLSGRFEGRAPTTIEIRGKAGHQTRRYQIEVHSADLTHNRPALAHLWARARIADIELLNIAGPTAVGAKRMEGIALQYGIVSTYTALVGVEAP